METLIVDLSHWNPTPDWVALKASGVVGVIHKATEGSSNVDDTLFERAKDATMAGLRWATYHFLRPASDMSVQIDHYLDTIDPVKGERVCLDHEDEGVSLADLKAAIQHIIDVRPDLRITLYSGHVIEQQLGTAHDEFLAEHVDLWTCEYGDPTPEWPAETWPQWKVWQYTDAYDAAGTSQPVDGNYFNGGVKACIFWFGPFVMPKPEPVQPLPEVAIATTGLVRVTVNGTIV